MEVYKNLSLDNLDGEIWKEIEGYNGDYFISNLGRVKSFKKCRGINVIILKQYKNNGIYLRVDLCKNGKQKNKLIHILMFETFNNYKLKKDEIVHHIDFTKDNFLDNFQLMTKSEHSKLHNSGKNNSFYNKKHTEKTKKLMRGENGSNSILTEENVIKIKQYFSEGILTQKEIGELFGVSKRTISDIKTGKCWKHIK